MADTLTDDRHPIVKLWEWAWSRLDRTIGLAARFTYPSKVVSPLGFLGVLTFITFLILGITGALLLIYYQPTFALAFDSVELIEKEIPYGYLIRNVHYHASNAMIFLAIAHMYYQYFSGRFKLRNEVIWVTGVILGSITILEAFTGYDLIFNDRAVLAISIGASLNNAAPLLGPLIVKTAFGEGFGDIIIRFYAYHVFIIPIAMITIMLLHFPKAMVFDIPMVAGISGAILIAAGLFPIDLGVKFDPSVPPPVTVPEWYFGTLYAFLRTGVDKFISGIILPTIFILLFLIIPFIDTNKKYSWKDRPFFTAVGITSIVQAAVTTAWGFYIIPAEIEPDLTARLFIEPLPFYTIMIALAGVSFGITYLVLHYVKKADAARRRPGTSRIRPTPIKLSPKWIFTVLISLIILQVFLNIAAVQAYMSGFKNLALLEVGLILVAFAIIFHAYRYGQKALYPTPKKH